MFSCKISLSLVTKVIVKIIFIVTYILVLLCFLAVENYAPKYLQLLSSVAFTFLFLTVCCAGQE